MTVGAEQGEIAEVGSPIDVAADPAIDAVRPLRWTSQGLAIAAVLLALFNGAAIGSWADELPAQQATHVRGPVTGWTGGTAAAHLDAPRAWLHDRWNAARAARFGSERPGEPGAN